MKLAVRHDPYQGRVLTLDGCDHPWQRGRGMYTAYRAHGWPRRIALAVALHTVAGIELARRYLVREGSFQGSIQREDGRAVASR